MQDFPIGLNALSEDVVAFLMQALIDGRISRAAACRLVTPWVVNDETLTGAALTGTQSIHGFDMCVDTKGIQCHESDGVSGLERVFSDEDVARKASTWLARWAEP